MPLEDSWADVIWIGVELVILLALSAVFSSAEVVFFSKEVAAEHGGRRRLLERPSQLLATLLIGNNLVNIAFILRFAEWWSMWLRKSLEGWVVVLSESVVIMLLLVFLGEIFPKLHARKSPLAWAAVVVPVVSVAYYLFWPLSRMLDLLGRIFRKEQRHLALELQPREIREALEATEGQAPVSLMLRQLLEFQDLEVRQIMTPLREVVAYSDDLSFEQLVERINEDQYSRVPVYHGTLDNIRGILYIKDLLPYLDRPSFEWTRLLRPVHYVPESMKLPDLLAEFRNKGVHMAIVVDEYGHVVGLVTLEDLLEEIVGEIQDEFDIVEAAKISQQDEYTWMVYGRATIPELARALDVPEEYFDPHAEEIDTVGGLVMELLGKMPQSGDRVQFRDLEFIVEQATPITVELLSVKRDPSGKET